MKNPKWNIDVSEDLSKKLARSRDLKTYLSELSALCGRAIRSDELGSAEEARNLRNLAQKFSTEPSVKYEMPFSDRTKESFRDFSARLQGANPSTIYVWTPRTISSGTFVAPSIGSIKFNFDFEINPEGILTFLTSDLKDRLLLDFSTSSGGEEYMTIETQGPNWTKVIY
jgi:hypothetical protein